MPQTNHAQISLRDMPIRRKLLAVTLVVALLINIVSLAGFQLSASQSNRMIYTQTAGSLGVISDKIASRLNSLMDISLYTAINQEFQKSLQELSARPVTTAQAVARASITGILYRTFHSDIITISVVPQKAATIVLGLDSSQEEEVVYSRALALAAEAKGAPVWLSTGRSDGSVLLVREIRNTTAPFLEPMGMLVFRVNLDKIVRESAENILTGEYKIALAQGGKNFYPYMEEGQELPNEAVFGSEESYAIKRQHGEMRFLARSSIRAFRLHWSLILSIPYNDVFHALVAANVLFFLCLGFAVVLAMLLSRRMLGGINRDVSLLADKMERVRKGDLEPHPNPHALGQDELGILNRHFDEMTADFKQVIEDNYVKQLLLTQTQLKALEQQINPHFLYNSLESINWFARAGEGAKISSIAQALGRLLRSTLSQDEVRIPLKQELDILDSYLSIQRIRFPDTLRVHMQVDEEAMDFLMPKMSVQPLVENAIVHSLEENIGECHIDVRIALRNSMVEVEVENDGSEIDLDILSKLRARTVQSKGNGIGLINIDSRIKLLFGHEYGIRLRNQKGRVVVSFAIPANTVAEYGVEMNCKAI